MYIISLIIGIIANSPRVHVNCLRVANSINAPKTSNPVCHNDRSELLWIVNQYLHTLIKVITCALIVQHLFTDDKGVATFKGIPFMTSAGPCTSSIPKGNVK